jgi:hypothetical protein
VQHRIAGEPPKTCVQTSILCAVHRAPNDENRRGGKIETHQYMPTVSSRFKATVAKRLRPVPKSLSPVAKSLNHLRPALLKSEKIR